MVNPYLPKYEFLANTLIFLLISSIAATAYELMPTSLFFTSLGSDEMGGSSTLIICLVVLMHLAVSIRDLSKLPPKLMQLYQSIQRIEKHLLLRPVEQQIRDPTEIVPPATRPIVVQGTIPRARTVDFTSAHIAPSPTAFPVLRDVSLSLARGTLTVFTGNVGCGKTTLLRALIDRCTVVHGIVDVDDEAIAYCGQQAWIQNTSIKKNIVGPEEFNQLWYNEVVHRCALSEDILRFPNGHNEVAGPQGCNLTESQCHRLVSISGSLNYPHVIDILSRPSLELFIHAQNFSSSMTSLVARVLHMLSAWLQDFLPQTAIFGHRAQL